MTSKTVLITGCSTGIGRATAERLARRGHAVVATARRLDSIADLEGKGCRLLALDVTDEESMREAVEAVGGPVDVLVNNAGYSQNGALEGLDMDDVRRQFETNVFGLLRMCQLVLPGMRDRRSGTIVNIGSMGGRLTFPGGGIYHATKYAVEAISDVLRWEVKGFGIDVVLIEPGLIKTNFGETSVGTIKPEPGPYAEFDAAVGAKTATAYSSRLYGMWGGGPDTVAKAVEKAIKRPRPRRLVTPSAHVLVNQRKLMTDRMWDALLRSQFPQPR